MLRAKALEAAGQVMQANAVNRAHLQTAGNDIAGIAQARRNLLEQGHDLARRLFKDAAFGRHGKLLVGPLEKRHAIIVLQSADLLADRALRDAVSLAGRRETSEFDKVAENFQGQELHVGAM